MQGVTGRGMVLQSVVAVCCCSVLLQCVAQCIVVDERCVCEIYPSHARMSNTLMSHTLMSRALMSHTLISHTLSVMIVIEILCMCIFRVCLYICSFMGLFYMTLFQKRPNSNDAASTAHGAHFQNTAGREVAV